MSTPSRSAAALLALVLPLVVACGGPPAEDTEGAGQSGETVTLAPRTCWTGASLSDDPQTVLTVSKTFGVDYFDAAHALSGRPSFELTEACGAAHHVEVYSTVPVNQVQPVITSYATLLQPNQPAYRKLVKAVEKTCMTQVLARTAAQTKLPGALAEPALPEGVEIGWAPPSPEQWARGQRVYACTLSSDRALKIRFAQVFRKTFPTRLRTCIESRALQYVDCSRKHDRERILVLDLTAAVAAGKLPGAEAVREGAQGEVVDIAATTLKVLDKACTNFLRSVSRTKKLNGVAALDADRWPATEERMVGETDPKRFPPRTYYLVDCEADVLPPKKPVVTRGSVFNR